MSTTGIRVGPGLPINFSSHDLDLESSILKLWLSEARYDPLDLSTTNKELEDFMRSEMESKNLTCDQLERTLHLAASLIELGYHEHSLSEKKHMALFNWYNIYVDDMAYKDPSTFSVFQQRFLSGQPQLHPVLDALVEVLNRVWDFYEPLCANLIVNSVFDFFTSTCVEPDVKKLPLSQGPQRFSWFMRERTGLAVSYGLMMFTKSTQTDIINYIEGVPDMNFYICVVNDILSFHKEHLAGETSNYIYTRAKIDGKTPLQVLSEMTREAQVSVNTIHTVLSKSPRALKTWKVYERGYIAYHLALDRYKLKDLGL